MAEEITNTVASETPSAPAQEENVVVNQEPQSQEQQENVQAPVENSNEVIENKTQEQAQTVQQPTIEELQSKIKEYELRDEEDRALREKLGIQDVDQQTYNYMTMDQQIVNQGKQMYLKLCNDYGIDANPEKIDASIEALKQTDPAKAYDFQRKFEMLGSEVSNRRYAVQQQNTYYEINKFNNDYNQLLQASPALNNIMTQYVQTYGGNTSGMYNQLKSVMDIILPAYQEAFNAGKKYALEDKAKKDTSAVSGGVVTANTQTYVPSGAPFTREQISRMSTDEFSKYESVIRQQMAEGKII